MVKTVTVFIALALVLFAVPLPASVITTDTTWSGEVSLDTDVYVPEGITLTVSPGTVVTVLPSDSTKTDPEFISFRREIIVRGTLVAKGNKESPVTFMSPKNKKSQWAGIIIDGGSVILHSATVRNAETGIDIIQGSLTAKDSFFTDNRYGLVAHGRNTAVHMEDSGVMENDYGVFLLNGAGLAGSGNVIEKNRKKDRHVSSVKAYPAALRNYKVKLEEKSRIFEDEVIMGTVTWQGRIQVNGTVRVPLNSRLVILPGTIVEFSRKDTNNDGIGENGLFVQGGFIAKGTEKSPIIFRSAEKLKGMNDWDSINILNSDSSQNLIEYCQIENAYRGMHFHFANVAVKDSVIRNNYRGIQFQESIVKISGTQLYDNKSALWARDSEIIFSDNLIHGNVSGINFFRNILTFRGNRIVNNERGGLRVREGIPVVEENLIDGNRYGMMVVDAVYGTFSSNVISHNLETGIALRGPANIEITGNSIQKNGLYGISIQDSSAYIRGNLISDNGERGIGVISFQGIITENNILQNGIYNLGIDGDTDVAAQGNWWGTDDLESTIYDREDDPTRGRARIMPIMEKPAILAWPLKTIRRDAIWRGTVTIGTTVVVEPGTDLAVTAGAGILFAEGAGLNVRGKITARGAINDPVIFTSSSGGGRAAWDEILLEYADGSLFSDCVIENATWAIHVHFSSIMVERCSIRNNYGGMRFRSGPMEIRNSSFMNNEIGMRSNQGVALVTENIISENRIGVFVREKGSGLKIRKNNMFANEDYNIRVGDFNDEDVDARDNWWGGMNPADTIFDARQEPGIGMVKYEPFSSDSYLLETPLKTMNKKGKELKEAKPGAEKK